MMMIKLYDLINYITIIIGPKIRFCLTLSSNNKIKFKNEVCIIRSVCLLKNVVAILVFRGL